MVSSSTSAVMILYTSFTATTSFVVFGLLKVKTRWSVSTASFLGGNIWVPLFSCPIRRVRPSLTELARPGLTTHLYRENGQTVRW